MKMSISSKLSIILLVCIFTSSCSSEDEEFKITLKPPSCKTKDELTDKSLTCLRKIYLNTGNIFDSSYDVAYDDMRYVSFTCSPAGDRLFIIDTRFQSKLGKKTVENHDYALEPTKVMILKYPNLQKDSIIGRLDRKDLTLNLDNEYYACNLNDGSERPLEKIYEEELEKLKKDNKI